MGCPTLIALMRVIFFLFIGLRIHSQNRTGVFDNKGMNIIICIKKPRTIPSFRKDVYVKSVNFDKPFFKFKYKIDVRY